MSMSRAVTDMTDLVQRDSNVGKYDAHICGLMYVHLLGSTRYVTTFENQCCVVTFLDMKNLHLSVEENVR